MEMSKERVYDVSGIDGKTHMGWVAVDVGKGIPESEICFMWQITPETLSRWKKNEDFRCWVKFEQALKIGKPMPDTASEAGIEFWVMIEKIKKCLTR